MKIRNLVLGFVATAALGAASAASVYTVQFDNVGTTDPVITLNGQVVTNPGLSFLAGYEANVASLLGAGTTYTIDTVYNSPYLTGGVEQHQTVTRTADGTFSLYIDGVAVGGNSPSAADTLFFSANNTVSSFAETLVTLGYTRSPAAIVSYVSLYDYAVPGNQIANIGAVPEPESLALALAGLVTMGVLAKRRRAA